jgi:hypothetical protein
MAQLHTAIRSATFAIVGASCFGLTHNIYAQDSTPNGVELLNKSSGKETSFADFFVDDAAASVSAASLVGIDPSAVTIAEATNDFAAFAQGINAKDKGGGFALSPARVRKPWPRVDLKDYLNGSLTARALAGLTLSYAQGSSEIEGANYVRHAVAVATSGVFRMQDDPIWNLANSVGSTCASTCAQAEIVALSKEIVIATQKKLRETGKTTLSPEETKEVEATGATAESVKAALQKCIDRGAARLDQRWFRPIWSLTLATGNVRQDLTGAKYTRMGTTIAGAARYGQGLAKPKPSAGVSAAADGASDSETEFEWGWAISGSYKTTLDAPILSSLGTASINRENSRVAALKVAGGTDVWRAIAEGSKTSSKSAETGERVLRRALGLDYKIGKGMWLNFRYGKRDGIEGGSTESATLLSLTISPTALIPK